MPRQRLHTRDDDLERRTSLLLEDVDLIDEEEALQGEGEVMRQDADLRSRAALDVLTTLRMIVDSAVSSFHRVKESHFSG